MAGIRQPHTRIWVLVCFLLVACFIGIQTYAGTEREKRHRSLMIREYETRTEQQLSIKDLNVAFEKQIAAMKDLLLHGKDSRLYHEQLSHYYAHEREALVYLEKVISLLQEDDDIRSLEQKISDRHRALSKRIRKAIRVFNATDKDAHVLAAQLLKGSDKAIATILTSLEKAVNKIRQENIEQLQRKIEKKHFRDFLIIIVVSSMFLSSLYVVLDRKIKALGDSEVRQHTILNTLADALISFDDKWVIVNVNPAAEKTFGYTADELIGQKITLLLSLDSQRTDKAHTKASEPDPPIILARKLEMEGRRKDGSLFPMEVDVAPMRLENWRGFVGIMQDITKRKKAEEALREAAALNDRIIEASPIGLSLYDRSGQCIAANNSIAEIIGATRDQVLAQNYNDIDSWKKSGLFEAAKNAVTNQKNYRHEYDVITSFGKRAFFDCIFVPFKIRHKQRLLFMMDDITERKEAEKQQERALAEKETLLKEIHHRVKNNMQIVSSLLYLQSQKTENIEALAVIKESKDRIKAMGLIHEKLYTSGDLARINIYDYIQTLCQYLSQSYVLPGSVKFIVDAEDIFFSVDKAIPCGLIINELVTNSLKHAFQDRRPGEIHIKLSRTADRMALCVQDNGIGLTAEYDENSLNTLGMKLVRTLADQLEASLEFQGDNGLKCVIVFRIDDIAFQK